jgi:hypothetical protein
MAEQLIAKVVDGKVSLVTSNGSVRSAQICVGAVSAVVSGDEVHCTMKNGKVQIHSFNGSLKGTV